MKSEVNRVKRKGERTVPCGAPVLLTTLSDTQFCRCNGLLCDRRKKELIDQKVIQTKVDRVCSDLFVMT